VEGHKCFDHCSFGVFLENQTHQQINEHKETTKLMKGRKSRDMVYFSNVLACFSPSKKRLKPDPPENDCYALACFLGKFFYTSSINEIPSFFCMQKNLGGIPFSLKNGGWEIRSFPVWMRLRFILGRIYYLGIHFFKRLISVTETILVE